MKNGIFVTGTNTGVGKTLLSSLLVAANGANGGYFKPVQTGEDSDTATVSALCGIPISHFPQPIYSFPEPTAPYRAALLHEQEIQLDRIVEGWKNLDDRTWVVEGAGGLLVPLNRKQSIRDLACAFNLKVIIAASTQLGTINHTLLTVESAKAAGLNVAGIVLNGPQDEGLEKVLFDLSGVPVIAQIPLYPVLSKSLICSEGVRLFPAERRALLYG